MAASSLASLPLLLDPLGAASLTGVPQQIFDDPDQRRANGVPSAATIAGRPYWRGCDLIRWVAVMTGESPRRVARGRR